MSDNRSLRALTPEELDSRTTLTIEEISLTLGIGRNTAYQAVRTGEIPSIRIGRRILVPVAAFEKMLSEAGQVANHDKR